MWPYHFGEASCIELAQRCISEVEEETTEAILPVVRNATVEAESETVTVLSLSTKDLKALFDANVLDMAEMLACVRKVAAERDSRTEARREEEQLVALTAAPAGRTENSRSLFS